MKATDPTPIQQPGWGSGAGALVQDVDDDDVVLMTVMMLIMMTAR